jgi:hypothetical protein
MIDLSHALPYLSPATSSEDTAPIHAWGSLDAPILRAFSRSLIVNYVIDDEPGALVYVRERDVTESGREDLHLCAIDNLRRRVAQKKVRFEPLGAAKEPSALRQAKLDGQMEASLLLLDELWEEEVVAVVPARSTLVFASVSKGLDELRTHCKKTSLSGELLVRRDKRWQPLKV